MGKFPPGLRSNLFPKFDLEDNADSRFDSLVGSEGLLGVQSQEENPWIEDFSGGSSGIGFCPTAAESCSISRRNNVWSEATSLESVEMLLKSVGQDEMIMGQTTTVIEESISKDRLGYLTTQMGLQNSDKDGSIASSKGLDVPNVNSVLPTYLSKEAANQILPLFEPTDGITGNGSNKKNEKRQGNVSIQSVTGYTSSLNTQIPACALFQHPFTNYQQVQLRAQIHVYGSLIREAAPDERCMVFSFGESDGGRSTWETEWLVALTRVQLQSDTFSTPDRAGGVGARPTMISPIAPTLSPSGLVQQLALTPSTRARVGNSTSVSARAPSSTSFHEFQHPFTNYQQVQLRAQIHVYGSLIREAAPDERCMVFSFGESDGGRSTWETEWLVALTRVQLQSDTFSTPDRAGGVGARPTMISPITPTLSPSGLVQQLALTPSTRARVGNSTSVSARSPSSILDVKRTPPPLGKQASVQWAKGSASLEIDQISSVVQPTLAPEPVSSLGDGHQLPTTSVTSIAEDPSSFDPNVSATSSFSLTTASPTPPRLSVHVLACPVDTEQLSGIVLSDETCRQIDQAQRQEEKASFLAAAAVNHSRSVWTQLAIQKSSGLVADREAKLASAAVTIAAAAAVAKAAAAGAKIASDAALQAKLMADEVLILPCELGKSTSDECLHSGLKNMVNFISPASILKGKDRSNISDSILVAAREAAQKRVEAALAATRRAKNWDAVIKAAGMAAEAVSQASTVTAMGEPIPFTLQELSEAGPENYWKLQRRHMFSDQIAKPNSCATNMAKQLEVVCGEEEVTRCIEHNSEETEGTPGQGRKAFPPHELSKQVENSNLLVNGMLWGPAWDSEKGLIEPKPGKTSGFDETIGAAPKSQVKSIRALQNAQSEGYGEAQESAQTSTENQIDEGSVLEVLSCEEGLGRWVWLPAKALNLKDGKAYVCRTELARGEGSDQFRECVSLDGEEGQGTRKRQRSNIEDCSWPIGDKEDAWINKGSGLATRVTGRELGPAKVDTSELQKLKTMLEKVTQESRSKDESLKKLRCKILKLESKVRSQDQLCKHQQEKIKELERNVDSKLEVHSQSEKQVWQLHDQLKGREETCIGLQHKVTELESKLKERENTESLALQHKIKELEIKLKEKAQPQSKSVILQLMAREKPEFLHPILPKHDSIFLRPRVPLREIRGRREISRMGLGNDGSSLSFKDKVMRVGVKIPVDMEKGRSDSSDARILRTRRVDKDAAVTRGWPR